MKLEPETNSRLRAVLERLRRMSYRSYDTEPLPVEVFESFAVTDLEGSDPTQGSAVASFLRALPEPFLGVASLYEEDDAWVPVDREDAKKALIHRFCHCLACEITLLGGNPVTATAFADEVCSAVPPDAVFYSPFARDADGSPMYVPRSNPPVPLFHLRPYVSEDGIIFLSGSSVGLIWFFGYD